MVRLCMVNGLLQRVKKQNSLGYQLIIILLKNINMKKIINMNVIGYVLAVILGITAYIITGRILFLITVFSVISSLFAIYHIIREDFSKIPVIRGIIDGILFFVAIQCMVLMIKYNFFGVFR